MTDKQYIKNKIEEWTKEMERQYARYKCEHVTEAVRKFSYGEYTRLNINIDCLEKDLEKITEMEEINKWFDKPKKEIETTDKEKLEALTELVEKYFESEIEREEFIEQTIEMVGK